jgi:hypothetical protein
MRTLYIIVGVILISAGVLMVVGWALDRVTGASYGASLVAFLRYTANRWRGGRRDP